jgi:hypothetical protein
VRAATNGRKYNSEKPIESPPTDWTNLFEHDIDIENFHVKSIFFYDNQLMMFARGKPRNVIEQCCSFILIFKLILNPDGTIKDIDAKNYNYIKLDPVVYPQYLARPTI